MTQTSTEALMRYFYTVSEKGAITAHEHRKGVDLLDLHNETVYVWKDAVFIALVRLAVTEKKAITRSRSTAEGVDTWAATDEVIWAREAQEEIKQRPEAFQAQLHNAVMEQYRKIRRA